MIIKPFKAIRPSEAYASDIAALPYDVYNREEAIQAVKGKPYSFLRVDRAEVELSSSVSAYDKSVYEAARDKLYDMIQDGYFIQDSNPYFYIYQLTMNKRVQTGLVVCTSIDEYFQDQIKKHELTREEKEQDRINHVDTCNAHTGPIFLTYSSQEVIDKLIQTVLQQNAPIYDFESEDEIRHTVWRIDQESVIQQLMQLFDDVQALYIADGHHRAASAAKVGKLRREQHPTYTGNEPYNYFLSVIFPDNQLKILDYNRVVKDLNGLTTSGFLEEISKVCEVEQLGTQPFQPSQKAEFGLFLCDQWYKLKAKHIPDDLVESLDVSILQNTILSPILNIQDPRTDKRIDFVGGIRGLKELERRVHTDMKVAFSLYPTSIHELMAIADAGKLMPPKSTWFEPKLRSGLFIHKLEG